MSKYSTAAMNCSEVISEALRNDGMGQWIAIRLSDGKSDGNIYPSKRVAVAFQLHETQCAYIKIPPGGMQPVEAERYIEINRKLYDKGMRLSDPDASPILPYTQEGYNYFMKG